MRRKIMSLIFVSFFSIILASGCKRVDVKATAAQAIIETINIMESRTPYPTYTFYPTQQPYDTQTPFPGSEPQKDQLQIKKSSAIAEPTPYPTQTAYPTESADHQMPVRNEILLNPGIWQRDLSQWGQCGNSFEMTLGNRKPYFTYAIGNEVSKNQFLIVNLVIRNTSDKTIPLLFHKQFKLVGELNGEEVTYTSYGPAGQSASDFYGTQFIGGVGLPPQVDIETYIAFDADYHASNWKLIFQSDDSSDLDCYVSIEIPQIEFGINYYATMQSEQASQ